MTTLTLSTTTLADRLLEAERRHGGRTALWVDGVAYTYRELFDRASALAAELSGHDEPMCLVYCGKNLTRYVGILASVLAGKVFVPLCPTSPAAYCTRVLDQLAGQLVAVVDTGDDDLDARIGSLGLPPAQILHRGSLSEPPAFRRPQSGVENDGAYLMFTSGSTGVPKAVLVSQRNLMSYLDGAIELFSPTEVDRFAQVNNFTFDLSVHDIFLPWVVGAAVYAVGDAAYKLPEAVREHELTFWLSVPTTGLTLADLGLLGDGSLPSLRVTLFCGEPMPRRLAGSWHAANPDGRLINVYGPTEATIAVTAFEWVSGLELPEVVPIGAPYPGQRVAVVDDQLRPVAPRETGELLLSGSQTVAGYYGNPEQTARRFVSVPGLDGVWYRTGDWVAADDHFGLVYKGRRDDQLQVRGFRVERLEIETLMRNALGTDSVGVVGWPVVDGSVVQGLVAFVADVGLSVAEIRRRFGEELPEHMWPSRIHLGPLPQNRSLKVDYPALKARLEAGL